MDQGAIAIGPRFLDKNLFGTHLALAGCAPMTMQSPAVRR